MEDNQHSESEELRIANERIQELEERHLEHIRDTNRIFWSRRTRIFSRWLRINLKKPWTIFMAMLFPFLQAFMASVVSIYTNNNDTSASGNISLFAFSAIYYLSFAMNSKRATKGSWLGLVLLIVFGALGILCGKLFLIWTNS